MKSIHEILLMKRNLIVGGAHDVLSAKILEECNYDAVWLSGLGLSSTFRGLPDASIIDPSEIGRFVMNISSVINIPLIVDMDSGYGNATNAYYNAKSFAKLGASGLCIEDNIFPKCNSFYQNKRKDLVSISEMQGKLKAMREGVGENVFIIARNESLIANKDIEEAIDRSYAYLDAGADSLVVHSSSWDSIARFLEEWKENCNMTVIPTKFPEMDLEILKQHFDIIIFANQALRASVTAMYSVLRQINKVGLNPQIEEQIAPLSNLFNLVQMDRLSELESKYLN